jgi:hypothetical protein
MKRFTLRDLFWLVLVVAMATAWGLDRLRWRAEVRRYKDIADRIAGFEAARNGYHQAILQLEQELIQTRAKP